MKQFGELVDTENLEVTYTKGGEDVTETFVISKIPGFQALKIHAKAAQVMQNGEVAAMPDSIVRDLLKYAAHNNVVLDEEVLINSHCHDDEVIIAVAMGVWKKNFAFFNTERFQGRMAELRKLLG